MRATYGNILSNSKMSRLVFIAVALVAFAAYESDAKVLKVLKPRPPPTPPPPPPPVEVAWAWVPLKKSEYIPVQKLIEKALGEETGPVKDGLKMVRGRATRYRVDYYLKGTTDVTCQIEFLDLHASSVSGGVDNLEILEGPNCRGGSGSTTSSPRPPPTPPPPPPPPAPTGDWVDLKKSEYRRVQNLIELVLDEETGPVKDGKKKVILGGITLYRVHYYLEGTHVTCFIEFAYEGSGGAHNLEKKKGPYCTGLIINGDSDDTASKKRAGKWEPVPEVEWEYVRERIEEATGEEIEDIITAEEKRLGDETLYRATYNYISENERYEQCKIEISDEVVSGGDHEVDVKKGPHCSLHVPLPPTIFPPHWH